MKREIPISIGIVLLASIFTSTKVEANTKDEEAFCAVWVPTPCPDDRLSGCGEWRRCEPNEE